MENMGHYGIFTVHSQYQAGGETLASNKTTTLTFRIEPGLKEALRTAAEREHRSIANMVEVLIRDYCEKHDIAIQKPQVIDNDKDTQND